MTEMALGGRDSVRQHAKRQTEHTPEEARQKLGIGRNAMYDALRTNKIQHIKNGRRYLIPVAVIDGMLACESAPKPKEA